LCKTIHPNHLELQYSKRTEKLSSKSP